MQLGYGLLAEPVGGALSWPGPAGGEPFGWSRWT
jgi:hypothetical protein